MFVSMVNAKKSDWYLVITIWRRLNITVMLMYFHVSLVSLVLIMLEIGVLYLITACIIFVIIGAISCLMVVAFCA